MRKMKAALLGIGLVLLSFVLPSCQAREEVSYFQPLLDSLAERGDPYTLTPLAQTDPDAKVPIYDATVWQCLAINGENLWVYFDSSNRAKQLAEQFCSGQGTGKVVYVGMRFIVCYPGAEEEIATLMDEWQNQYPV